MAKEKAENTKASTEAKKTVVDITPVFVDIHPEWTGKVIESRKYSPIHDNKRTRYDCRIAVANDDESAKKYFNCTLGDLIEAGCRQKSYEETVVKNLVETQEKAGLKLDSPDFLNKIAKEFKADLVAEKTKGTGSSVKAMANQLTFIYTKYGVDPKSPSAQADLEKAIIAKAGK